MTAIARQPRAPALKSWAMAAGLAAAVGLRWAATKSGSDGLAIGTWFGLGLLGLVLVSGWRPARERASSIPIGLLGGAVLVGLAVATHSGAQPSLAPPVAFAPWALITVLVASAEELAVRGALFHALARSVDVLPAALLTSIVFALMHVPLYGWHVVPLDLGVGLWLVGLRLWTGGILAPAIAHVAADLATWWL